MQAAPLPDFEKAQTRAASWLRAWDRQGLHRTGTAGDLAGAEWLGQEAMALGAEVWVEEFALDRVDPLECFVEFGVRQIAAVPVFDAPATDAEGVIGRDGVGGQMPTTGGGGAGSEQDRERETWLTEDEDVWNDEGDVAPPVIGQV